MNTNEINSEQPTAEDHSVNSVGEEQESEGFSVKDRRFWQLDEEEKQKSDHDLNNLKPTIVETLEKRLKEKEQQITELGVAIRAQREEQRKAVERMENNLKKDLLGLKVKTFGDFLEVIDNLELCKNSLAENCDAPAAEKGIALIIEEFFAILAKQGVEKIDVVNSAFNPDYCEAIAMEELADSEKDNQVLEEYRAGYMIEQRLLRPARVRVGRYSGDQKSE